MPKDDGKVVKVKWRDVPVYRACSPELGGTERRSHGTAGPSSHLLAPLGRHLLRIVGLDCALGALGGSWQSVGNHEPEMSPPVPGRERTGLQRPAGGRELVFILHEMIVLDSWENSKRTHDAGGESETSPTGHCCLGGMSR